MREIKFRAWDKDTHVMHVIFDSTKRTEWFLPNLHERFEIMQYTGLKDKNGHEIYEGDIIRWLNRDGVEFIGIVNWVDFHYEIQWIAPTTYASFLWDAQHGLEVIGNIYENRELFEGGNK